MAGNEVLLKLVARDMLNFAMRCFVFSVGLHDDLEDVMQKCWKGNSDNHRKIDQLAWRKLCALKDIRGLGFKDLRAFNLAMVVKQCWCLFKNLESLFAQVFKN